MKRLWNRIRAFLRAPSSADVLRRLDEDAVRLSSLRQAERTGDVIVFVQHRRGLEG